MRLKANAAQTGIFGKHWDASPFFHDAECFQQIVQQEGVEALWAGTVPSLVLVSNPVIHYFAYEQFKNKLVGKLSAHQHFVLAALSKMLATLVTYPLQVAQSKLRVSQ